MKTYSVCVIYQHYDDILSVRVPAVLHTKCEFTSSMMMYSLKMYQQYDDILSMCMYQQYDRILSVYQHCDDMHSPYVPAV